MTQWPHPRVRPLVACATTGLCFWLLVGAAAQSRFVGGAPARSDVEVRPSRLRFEPGARSNWHSHASFQIIMAEEGRGRTQVRGEPMQEMALGIPIYAAANVVHWHGAAPDEYLLQLTFSGGETSWFEPVSDRDYEGR